MIGVVRVGGYDKDGIKRSLATPRASKNVNVYGLSVDVFYLGGIMNFDRLIIPCY